MQSRLAIGRYRFAHQFSSLQSSIVDNSRLFANSLSDSSNLFAQPNSIRRQNAYAVRPNECASRPAAVDGEPGPHPADIRPAVEAEELHFRVGQPCAESDVSR